MAACGCADLEVIPDRRDGREAPLEPLVGFGEEQNEDHVRGAKPVNPGAPGPFEKPRAQLRNEGAAFVSGWVPNRWYPSGHLGDGSNENVQMYEPGVLPLPT